MNVTTRDEVFELWADALPIVDRMRQLGASEEQVDQWFRTFTACCADVLDRIEVTA